MAIGTDSVQDNSFKAQCGHFLDSTTAHGFSKIKGTSRLRRTLWQAVLLTCIAVVFYLLYNIHHKLSYPPITTKITTHLESSILLPAFTICNNNMYNKTALLKDPELVSLAAMALQGLMTSSIDNKTKEAILSAMNISLERAQSILLANYTDGNMTELYMNSSHTKEATILAAVDIIAGQKSFYDNITSQLTDMGHCYVYDNPDHVIKGPGTSEGVFLILHVHPEEYTFSEQEYYNEGFKISFHKHGDIPLMKDFGVGLSHGLSHMIGIKKSKKVYSERDHCVKTNRDKTSLTKRLALYDNYSKHNCLRECEVNFTSARCHCKLFYQPGNIPVCSNYELTGYCKRQMYSFTIDPEGKSACDCPVACEETEFDLKISTLHFPSQFYRDIVSNYHGIQGTLHGQLAVYIYMESMDVTTVEQIEAYGYGDVWGDLGGCLGLCLGASLITIIEILEFIILSFKWVFSRHKQRAPVGLSNIEGNVVHVK